jgi:transposase
MSQTQAVSGDATRYDKRAINFLGTIYLAAAVIWLN